MDLDQAGVGLVGVLDHHHGIGLGRHHAAGGNTHRRPGRQRLRRLFAHLHDAGKFQISRQTLTGAKSILGFDRIAVHRRAMKMRQIDRRVKIFRQNTAARLDGSDLFLAHRLNAAAKSSAPLAAPEL